MDNDNAIKFQAVYETTSRGIERAYFSTIEDALILKSLCKSSNIDVVVYELEHGRFDEITGNWHGTRKIYKSGK